MAISSLRRPIRRGHGLSPGKKAVLYVLIALAGATMLYPLLWMLSSSFKPTSLIFSQPSLIPSAVTLENYTDGWSSFQVPFGRYFLNSLLISVACVVGNVVSCSLVAYSFARLRYRAKAVWFSIMLLTIMIPYHVVIIPQYVMFSELDWINTFNPLIVPKFLATDSFFIFLMVQFIRGIPRDLDEAAKIDGAGPGRIYAMIILPLMMPALATTAIFTFIWTWNDFFSPLVYLTDQRMFTIPVALRSFLDATSQSSWGPLFAMSILSLIPIFAIFLFGQRFLIKGIATTGIR
ncbi:carbohydrate ABC transporter permease [Microlunatus speluncae]|uniref:carbohydrate ABC transporter permease n=1 Tax=Microlunatus speluncae TaxID=2594267 RepID=UPI0012661509|nr:carbohydrate ABC transporter permease [Microlunatus speluncae]